MFRIANSLDDLIKIFIVRAIVFMEEQSVRYEEEVDEYEFSVIHIIGEKDGEPFGSGRIRIVDEYAKLERIAIRRGCRGQNYGHQLLDFMIKIARERGFNKFKMHAQAHLRDFYQKHDFKVKGDRFKEANIDHYLMVRED